jgi:tRNA modification GTPase
LALAEGGLGRKVADWQRQLLQAAALVEAELDFSDEGDVAEVDTSLHCLRIAPLVTEIVEMLAAPPAERLRDGVRVVLAGPPNAGKSSLFNYLAGRHAAIVTDIAGTTRDRLEAPVVLGGVPLLLIDTAGLRGQTDDQIEAIGIARTGEALGEADLILWMGDAADAPGGAIQIAPKSDLGQAGPGLPVSTVSGEGLDRLRTEILQQARALLPKPGALALNTRHRAILADVRGELAAACDSQDLLITAEHLRTARTRLDALTGKAGVEDMLDALFGAFCIGK